MVRRGDARPQSSLKGRFGEAGRWLSGMLSGTNEAPHGPRDRPYVEGDGTGSSFAGSWRTTFGDMTLSVDGSHVTGTYSGDNTITGTVSGDILTFSYREASEAGTGQFRLLRHGAFVGEYLAEGGSTPQAWRGTRGFDGLWQTTFGRMRLCDEGDRIHGSYNGVGHATISGTRQGDRFVFRYQEAKAAGDGWFALSEDTQSFGGEWRADGASGSAAPWTGKRIVPAQTVQWLVVLEAHWQKGLAEPDFAFGFMLRELFARLPRVRVRHRFFDDEAALLRLCCEMIYLAEPAVIVITSHGEADGVAVNGAIINSRQIIAALAPAETLQMLHFSCCLIGQDAEGALAASPFPVSGYVTSVDWAQSAMTEFIYLDMVLGKHLPPAEAADQLMRLVAFAGDDEIEGSPYAPAGFRFFAPTTPTS
jgi:hypothetical protein